MHNRINGVDLARALAILGMMYAHLGPLDGGSRVDVALSILTSGFSSALFAVLAGVSVSIMMRRGVEEGGCEFVLAKHRLMLRGVALMGIGLALSVFQFSIAVVLAAIGALFLVLPPLCRWSRRALILTLVLLLALGPLALVLSLKMNTYVDVITGNYPLFAWLTYGVAGIVIHRLVVPSRRAQYITLALGTVLAGVGVWSRVPLSEDISGKKISDLKFPGLDGPGPDGQVDKNYLPLSDFKDSPGLSEPNYWLVYLSPDPHTGGLIDVATSISAASATIALCLLLSAVPLLLRASYPLRALGSMALTIYVGHVASAAFILTSNPLDTTQKSLLEDTLPEHRLALVLSAVIAIAFAVVWKHFFRRGPLEYALHRFVMRSTKTDLPGVDHIF